MSYSDNDGSVDMGPIFDAKYGWMRAHEAVLSEIATERRRQIHKEGWSREHDDHHAQGEMARAAACYAMAAGVNKVQRESLFQLYELHGSESTAILRKMWPWDWTWWKPKTRRHDLIRAAALIVAEIERIDRAALPLSDSEGPFPPPPGGENG